MSHTIQEAADLVGVKVLTLKRWENDGRYEVARSEGGHRRYNDNDILVLKALAAKTSPQQEPLSAAEKTITLSGQHSAIATDSHTHETYSIGYGTYRKVKPEDAVEYLAAAKKRIFAHGLPEPTPDQLAFRKMLMGKSKK